MAAINFPDSPTIGQVFQAGSSVWTWDGDKWASGIAPYAYLPIAGGSMTGPLLLSRDPVATAEATTKNYVDNQDSLALKLTGGTLTGPLTVNGSITDILAADGGIYIDSPAGIVRGILNTTAGLRRWFFGTTGEAESGGNAGSNWALDNFDDTGAFLDQPITVNRKTGVVTFSQPIQAPQGLLVGLVNKLRNPGFDIWSRGTSINVPTNSPVYTADGWVAFVSGTGTMVVARGLWAGTPFPTGSTNRAYMVVTGATGLTGSQLIQRIESWMASPLGGQTCTFQISIFNNTPSAFTPTFSLYHPSAVDVWTSPVFDLGVNLQACPPGVWTRCGVTFAVPATSALNGLGVYVTFPTGVLASGSNSLLVSAADLRATPGMPIGLTSALPAVEQRPLGIENFIGQRYYQTGNFQVLGWAGATATASCGGVFPLAVPMRAPPTMVPTYSLQQGGTGNLAAVGVGFYQMFGQSNAIGPMNISGTFTANAEL